MIVTRRWPALLAMLAAAACGARETPGRGADSTTARTTTTSSSGDVALPAMAARPVDADGVAAAATTVGRLTAGRAAFPSCEQAAVRTPAAMATMKRTGNATRTSAGTGFLRRSGAPRSHRELLDDTDTGTRQDPL